ncbi:hypothetical protein ABKN59_007653 [Abortiporus biennis]
MSFTSAPQPLRQSFLCLTKQCRSSTSRCRRYYNIHTTPAVNETLQERRMPLHVKDREMSHLNINTGGNVIRSQLDSSEQIGGSGFEPENENRGREISDQDWEIRTGRAIYILQETLPDFFSTGLISSLDYALLNDHTTASSSSPSSSATSSTNGHSSPTAFAKNILNTLKGKAKSNHDHTSSFQAIRLSESKDNDEDDNIYSPRIRLEYRPPGGLPSPLPNVLRIEGLHLYIASSIFVRHTMNAFYSDLKVELKRVRVHGPPSSPDDAGRTKSQRNSREKCLVMGLGVTGVGRVSGARAEWEINCTYTFSPVSGLIHLHTVDSIEPAPHQSIFEALGRFGLVSGGPGSDLTSSKPQPWNFDISLLPQMLPKAESRCLPGLKPHTWCLIGPPVTCTLTKGVSGHQVQCQNSAATMACNQKLLVSFASPLGENKFLHSLLIHDKSVTKQQFSLRFFVIDLLPFFFDIKMRFSTFLPVAGVVAVVAPALAAPLNNLQRGHHGHRHHHSVEGATDRTHHHHQPRGDIEEFVARGVPISRPTHSPSSSGKPVKHHAREYFDVEDVVARGMPSTGRPTHSPSSSGKPTGHHRREYFDVQDIFARGVPMGRPTHTPSGSGKPVRHHVRSYEYASRASPYYHHYYYHHARNEPSLELLARAILDGIELD